MSTPQPARTGPARPLVRKKAAPTLFHTSLKPVQGNPPRPAQIQRLKKQESSPDSKLSAATANVRLKASPTPPPGEGTSSPSGSQASQSQPKDKGPSPNAPPADLPYQDYKLMSCARHGWRYDVMKFDSRRSVDIAAWPKPVKLNRKEPKREGAVTEGALSAGAPVPVGPMLGPDGKPVIGADGRVVMADAEGKPIHDTVRGGAGAAAVKGKDDKDKGKKKKFQKKIKQVYFVPEHVRQLRREERYPWVIEDASGQEMWVGRMEEAAKSETHALFMPAADNVFRFVPAHRWYKFQKQRPQRHVLSLEEAEKLMAQKTEKQGRWMMRLREGVATSSSQNVPATNTGLRRMIVRDAGGGGGLFSDDDEEGSGARRREARARGQDGDADEMEYESDVADDEEVNVQQGMEDEVAKEIEERLKREYRRADEKRESDDEEEEGEHLSGAGKAMKKLVRKMEKNDAYDSDKEENPYASSEDEEEDEEESQPQTQPPGEPAVQQDQNASRSGSQAPGNKLASPEKGKAPSTRPSSKTPSRAGSPAPGGALSVKTEVKQESLGGHSVVAKRATSPRLPTAPKLKQNNSRASSPLAGSGSRAGSPIPPSGLSGGKSAKRKAEDSGAGSPGAPAAGSSSNTNGQPKSKKRKASAATASGAAAGSSAAKPTVAPGTDLTPGLLIRWLRETPNATTRDCIQYFQPCLAEDAKKARFTVLMKQLVTMKEGVLMLKPPYLVGDPDKIVVQE
ncbi:hypothetical protein SCHPADRAFT_898526 [Schizopora paradoxa]|uniref:Transcription initiation factor IIF subunit alpha n=1 Tax=Schizopora paradoxa TaxID=27342 RepID=A0A0H2S7Q7_9AGAM|nr:hypothetical protein SCHPADRAFT_898526 [Schizopora paradoxa]